MLFTDGIILSMQDLREHDNFVLEIASTESIELSSKLSIAQRAIGYELALFLSSRDTPIGVERVVVNEELRDVLAIHTLAAVYGDAYNRHLNDRYLGRAKEFRQASERSYHRFLQNGIGIAANPMPRAAKPSFSDLEGGALQAGIYVAQIAWENVTRTVGEWSEPATFECEGGALVIDPKDVPRNAAGWHIFLSGTEDPPVRQNQTLIEAGASWTQASALRLDLPATKPSGPDYFVRQGAQMVRR
jgi:hypothetical protein